MEIFWRMDRSVCVCCSARRLQMQLWSLQNNWPPYLEDVVVFVGRKRASKVISAKKADSPSLSYCLMHKLCSDCILLLEREVP